MKCDECKGEVVELQGELSCEDCGVINGVVFGDEYRLKFEHGGVGANLIQDKNKDGNDLGLGSKIGHERMKGAAKLRRLATIFSLSPEQRLLKKAMFFINIASSEFQLSDCAKTDMKLYYTELRKKGILTSGMVMEERAGALVYIILKEHGYAYTLKEVSKILDIPSKRISKISRIFARALGKSYVFATTDVGRLLEKFCLRFTNDRTYIADGINLFTYINKIESHHPTSGYLSGIIYLVETTKLTKNYIQKDIAEAFDVSVLTLRLNYKSILSTLGISNTYGLNVSNIIEGIR